MQKQFQLVQKQILLPRDRESANTASTEGTRGNKQLWSLSTGHHSESIHSGTDSGEHFTETGSTDALDQAETHAPPAAIKIPKAVCFGAPSPSPGFWPSLNSSNDFLWPKSALIILTTGKVRKCKHKENRAQYNELY